MSPPKSAQALYGLGHRHLFDFEAQVTPLLRVERRLPSTPLSICYSPTGGSQGSV